MSGVATFCKHKKKRSELRNLLCANREDVLAHNFDFDAERRPKVGTLHDTSAHPRTSSRKIGGFEGVKHCAAARISNHGMFRGAEAVVSFQSVQVSEVFKLAIAVRRFLREGPVATRLGGRSCRQADEQRGDVFAGEPIANIKLFRGPRLGHLRHVGDPGFRVGRMREQRARIGRGGGNFDLRLLFGGQRRLMLGTKSKARAQKNDEEHGEKSDDKFDGGIRCCR